MVERSAGLVAERCCEHEIPVTWLFAADLKAGKRGLTTHKAVSDAFKRGTHWDPGQGFPVERYLALVRKHLKAGSAQPVKLLKDDPPRLARGAEGWEVKRLQKLLRQHGLLPAPAQIDGDYGEITEAAVLAFQALNDLNPDGVAGNLTWHALLTADVNAANWAPAPVR